MTAEDYLKQIIKYDEVITNKKKDYQRWKDIADGLGDFAVTERVQTSRNLHKGQNAIIEYISIEGEIKELERKRQEVINTIQSLPYHEYRVIYKIYVEGYMVKELPSILNRSYGWVKKKKSNALNLVQKMIDEPCV